MHTMRFRVISVSSVIKLSEVDSAGYVVVVTDGRDGSTLAAK